MTNRQTGILGVATLVAVLAALWVVFSDRGGEPKTPDGGPLLADFGDEAASVDTIAITKQDATVTLQKTEGGWGIAERGGFPADANKVRGLLRGLARSERLEAKTDNPALFDRIELGEEAKMLTARAGETAVASLKIGKRQLLASDAKTFVLVNGEDRAWLVSELPGISAEADDWLEKEILAVARNRIAGVTVTHADGAVTEISRPGPEAANFKLAGLGEDEELNYAGAASTVAAAITSVRMEDVVAATKKPFEADATAVFKTFDGLTVTAEVAEIDEEFWARFGATYDAAVAESETAPEAMPDAAPDGQAEADRLSALFAERAFRLPRFKAEDMIRARGDLIRPKPEPEDAPAN